MIFRFCSSLKSVPARKLWACALMTIVAAIGSAVAQPGDGEKTNKQIRFVVPFPAGGTLDILARVIGQELAPALGRPVIVENRPGASGAIGAEAVARGPKDGSMLVIMSNTLATLPALRADLPFNIDKDLAPVAEIGSTPTVMTLHPSFPARTTLEFIAAAKTMPNGVDYTSPAVASAPHLAGELLARLTGIKLVHIAYRGSGPAVTGLVAGQVKMMMAPLSNVQPFFETKKLIPIAMTDDKRSPWLPDVPTLQESGVPQIRPMAQWYGIMTTGDTPPDVIARYNGAIRKILSDPGVRKTLEAQTFVIKTNTPQEFSAHLREEISQSAILIKDANIGPQ
jgi:tripartite-type tricarboxylate transporter receptor subunit TctC